MKWLKKNWMAILVIFLLTWLVAPPLLRGISRATDWAFARAGYAKIKAETATTEQFYCSDPGEIRRKDGRTEVCNQGNVWQGIANTPATSATPTAKTDTIAPPATPASTTASATADTIATPLSPELKKVGEEACKGQPHGVTMNILYKHDGGEDNFFYKCPPAPVTSTTTDTIAEASATSTTTDTIAPQDPLTITWNPCKQGANPELQIEPLVENGVVVSNAFMGLDLNQAEVDSGMKYSTPLSASAYAHFFNAHDGLTREARGPGNFESTAFTIWCLAGDYRSEIKGQHQIMNAKNIPDHLSVDPQSLPFTIGQ